MTRSALCWLLVFVLVFNNSIGFVSSSEEGAFYKVVEAGGVTYLIFNRDICDLYYRGFCVILGNDKHLEIVDRSRVLYGSLGMSIERIATISVLWRDEPLSSSDGIFVYRNDSRIQALFELGLNVLWLELYYNEVSWIFALGDSKVPLPVDAGTLAKLLENTFRTVAGVLNARVKKIVVIVLPQREEHVKIDLGERVLKNIELLGELGITAYGLAGWAFLPIFDYDVKRFTTLEDLKPVIDKIIEVLEIPDESPVIMVVRPVASLVPEISSTASWDKTIFQLNQTPTGLESAEKDHNIGYPLAMIAVAVITLVIAVTVYSLTRPFRRVKIALLL